MDNQPTLLRMPSPRRGFTLLELLVVITIILVLAGMVIAGVGIALKMQAKAKTTKMIADLGFSLSNIRQTTGQYPGEKTALEVEPSPRPASWFAWNALFPSNLAFNANDSSLPMLPGDKNDGTDARWRAVAARLRLDLDAAGDQTLPKVLEDAWGHPLRYRPARRYPFLANNTPSIDSQTPDNPDTYQIWSAGPDEVDGGGDSNVIGGTDDLTTWKR